MPYPLPFWQAGIAREATSRAAERLFCADADGHLHILGGTGRRKNGSHAKPSSHPRSRRVEDADCNGSCRTASFNAFTSRHGALAPFQAVAVLARRWHFHYNQNAQHHHTNVKAIKKWCPYDAGSQPPAAAGGRPGHAPSARIGKTAPWSGPMRQASALCAWQWVPIRRWPQRDALGLWPFVGGCLSLAAKALEPLAEAVNATPWSPRGRDQAG